MQIPRIYQPKVCGLLRGHINIAIGHSFDFLVSCAAGVMHKDFNEPLSSGALSPRLE